MENSREKPRKTACLLHLWFILFLQIPNQVNGFLSYRNGRSFRLRDGPALGTIFESHVCDCRRKVVCRAAFDDVSSSVSELPDFTHEDIVWKIRPPEDSSRWKRLKWRCAANLLRLDCWRRGFDPPLIMCPKGSQAMLEAYVDRRRVARFGISTGRGPTAPPIAETILDLYGETTGINAGIAAIVYMFVEPEYRKRQLGCLALEVISFIHAIRGCDFIMLVADDTSESRSLVRWYESQGYSQAPKLQALMGSPNQEYGVSMIAPTRGTLLGGCRIQWW